MPLIYTATCPHCGHEACAHDPTLAIQRDDGSLLHLPHPSESRHLEAAGLTWRQAANQARLIRTTTRLCRSCGQFVKLPNRVPPEGCLGALVGLAGLVLTFLAVTLLHDYATAPAFVHVTRSQLASILTPVAPAALVALALWRIIRFVETRTFRANLPLRQPIPQPPCLPPPPPPKAPHPAPPKIPLPHLPKPNPHRPLHRHKLTVTVCSRCLRDKTKRNYSLDETRYRRLCAGHQNTRAAYASATAIQNAHRFRLWDRASDVCWRFAWLYAGSEWNSVTAMTSASGTYTVVPFIHAGVFALPLRHDSPMNSARSTLDKT